MADPEKKHLSIEIVHTPDWALRNVGRKGKRVGSDAPSLGPSRRKGEELIAPHHSG
jgi:hypothetical protein